MSASHLYLSRVKYLSCAYKKSGSASLLERLADTLCPKRSIHAATLTPTRHPCMMHMTRRRIRNSKRPMNPKVLHFRQCMLSSTALSRKHRDVLDRVALVLACHAGKLMAIRFRGTLVEYSECTQSSRSKKGTMTENTLTIIFGCLATVLAIAGIFLACLQFRAHIRLSTHDATPSTMENARSRVWTGFIHRRLTLERSNLQYMLPIMMRDGPMPATVSQPGRHFVLR